MRKAQFLNGKSSKIAKIWQKMKKNQFFVFRPPFFAEKRKIGKKRKTKILRFGGTHIGHWNRKDLVNYLANNIGLGLSKDKTAMFFKSGSSPNVIM